MVSSCCDAKSMIGERISKATYDGVTLNMGYCSECRNHSVFIEEKGKERDESK